MIVNETQIRVRYGETDRMGYVYYGNYLLYYEVGRTEMIRQLGLTYRQLEDNGTLLPVHSVQIKYIAPATYDDLLTVRTTLRDYPGVSINFEYEIINSAGKIINTAEVKLVFINSKTNRPVRAPKYFLDLVDPFFNAKH
jgi:acyl-CoA thioester hydrolase